jgi:quercetin dioxygenase-like cupin family protein
LSPYGSRLVGMTDAVIVPALDQVPLRTTEQPIYDQPFELQLLYQDTATGAEHYVIRYPAGLTGTRHTHSVAHTIVVIEGRLMANGEEIGPGSYVHFPANTVMHHEPAAGTHCLFVTIFDGPFDVRPA